MMQIKKLQLKERFRFRLKLRDFPQIIYQIVPYVPDFVTFLFFFLIFTLKTLASSHRKMYREIRHVKEC